MQKISTKQHIMDVALTLFSKKGYDAVGVEEIAREVGIKAPSLYKHYKSKQDIFDSIFKEMERRYDEQITSMELHFSDAVADRDMFAEITEDGLVKKVQGLVAYSLHDEYVSRFRRLLTIEQFRSNKLGELYTKRYVDFLVVYHEKLFEQLVKLGVLKEENCYLMALQYVSPVCVLIGICDRQPEREEEVMKLIEAHIRQFNRVYRKKEFAHEA